MNDNIKFRVWDGSRYYYFDMFTDKGNYTLSYNDVSGWNVNKEPPKPNDLWLCGDSSDTPMKMEMFTGLYDKNDREMYGGDIYKRILDKRNAFPNKKYEWADYWLIEWLSVSAGFTTTLIGSEEIDGFKKEQYVKRNSFSQRFKEMDIYIGNIHENPELLPT